MAGKSLDDINVGLTGRKWTDGLAPYKFRDGWQRLRLYGLVYQDARHNVKTKSGKGYYEYCHAFDSDHDCYKEGRDQLCECCRLEMSAEKDENGQRPLASGLRYFMNVLDMDKYDSKPGNVGPNWSPIYMADFSPTLMKAIRDLKQLNGNVSVSHPQRGAIINVKFDKTQPPAAMYQVNLDTKNHAFDDDMIGLTVVQTLPDGKKVVQKGDGTAPGGFVYYRATSPRDEMIRSLERNGYYERERRQVEVDPGAQAFARKHAANLAALDGIDDGGTPPPKASGVKQLAKLHAVEEKPLPKASSVQEPFNEDEVPFDQPPQKAKSAGGSEKAPEDCPAAFGKFARAALCFTRCSVRKACEAASSTAKKAVGAEVFEDDSL